MERAVILAKGAMVSVRRRRPWPATTWIPVRIEIASGNGRAIAVSAPEALGVPGGGFGFDRRTHRMMLFLLREEGGEIWRDVWSDAEWYVRAAGTDDD
jgi:hypothetical protein